MFQGCQQGILLEWNTAQLYDIYIYIILYHINIYHTYMGIITHTIHGTGILTYIYHTKSTIHGSVNIPHSRMVIVLIPKNMGEVFPGSPELPAPALPYRTAAAQRNARNAPPLPSATVPLRPPVPPPERFDGSAGFVDVLAAGVGSLKVVWEVWRSVWETKHRHFLVTKTTLVGGWTNPFEKYLLVKLDHETPSKVFLTTTYSIW